MINEALKGRGYGSTTYLFQITNKKTIQQNIDIVNRSISKARELGAIFEMVCPDYDDFDLNLVEIKGFRVWFKKIMDGCPLLYEEFLDKVNNDRSLMSDGVYLHCCASIGRIEVDFDSVLIYVGNRYVGRVGRYPSQIPNDGD